MGMAALTSDMAKQRWALQSSFLEAEAAARGRLAEVDGVRDAVEGACRIRLPPAPGQPVTPLVPSPVPAHPASNSLIALLMSLHAWPAASGGLFCLRSLL